MPSPLDDAKAYLGTLSPNVKVGSRLIARLVGEVERMQLWVNDLQSGMYINCVYCGHRYGPREDTPSVMADVLREHIEQCPQHPLSQVTAERNDLARALFGIRRLTMRGRGDSQVADIACDAVRSIDEGPLFPCEAAETEPLPATGDEAIEVVEEAGG